MYSIIYYTFNLDVRELAKINYPNKTTLCKCDAMQDDVCTMYYIHVYKTNIYASTRRFYICIYCIKAIVSNLFLYELGPLRLSISREKIDSGDQKYCTYAHNNIIINILYCIRVWVYHIKQNIKIHSPITAHIIMTKTLFSRIRHYIIMVSKYALTIVVHTILKIPCYYLLLRPRHRDRIVAK